MSRIACISAALLLSVLGLVAAQQGPSPANTAPEASEPSPADADGPPPFELQLPVVSGCNGCACG